LVKDTNHNIGIVITTARECRCRCGHVWTPRVEGRPGVCPKCKNYKWDEPFVKKGKKTSKKKGDA
jgi:predicted Zn-ribbon and HTH transcriptional regulator